jgi:hypothetical protein
MTTGVGAAVPTWVVGQNQKTRPVSAKTAETKDGEALLVNPSSVQLEREAGEFERAFFLDGLELVGVETERFHDGGSDLAGFDLAGEG